MENKKKQLLDTMKALPMTMEDKCAFVDLISQSSGNGSNQEDEWFYFDVRGVDTNLDVLLSFSPYIIVEMDGKVLESHSSVLINVATSTEKAPIAVKTRKWICMITESGNMTEVKLEYIKADAIKYMNFLGAKQITKEEYNSFINFTEDDFVERPTQQPVE